MGPRRQPDLNLLAPWYKCNLFGRNQKGRIDRAESILDLSSMVDLGGGGRLYIETHYLLP